MKFLQSTLIKSLLAAALLTTGIQTAAADPFVRISTSYGDFTIELLPEAAPATVANFLGYVDRGDYSRLFVHRLSKDFVVQTGGQRWPGDSRTFVNPGPAVVNEPGISNTRGTLAMAKMGGDPNSATNEWFINLADNSANLDNQNGGFTVFARVLGDGMDAADRINSSATILGPNNFNAPAEMALRGSYIGYPTEKNLVMMNAYRVDRYSSAMHVFEYSSARLNTYVDAGALGKLSLTMRIVEDNAQTIFQIDPLSIVQLAIEPEGMAVFDPETLVLRIPRVEVSNQGQVSILNNVVMRVVDVDSLRLVLESFE